MYPVCLASTSNLFNVSGLSAELTPWTGPKLRMKMTFRHSMLLKVLSSKPNYLILVYYVQISATSYTVPYMDINSLGHFMRI